MMPLTLSVAVVGATVIWLTRPIAGLVTYLVLTCLYPQYLAVSIASIDLTSGQILLFVMMLRMLTRPLDPSISQIRWLDVFVLLSFTCTTLSFLTKESPARVLVREGGQFLDTVVVYAAARLSLRSREDVFQLIRALVVTGVILATIGVYQAATGHNPYGWMRTYSPFGLGQQFVKLRMGFQRADASFGNMIPFGLFFSLVISLHVAQFFSRRQNPFRFMAVYTVLTLGLLSSMSSAPMFALVVAMVFASAYPFRRFWPYLAAVAVVVCVVIEVASDRHFYEVLTRLALNSDTANYRVELYNEALNGGMSGHWLTGYGYVGMNDELGPNFLPWIHQDLVNMYIHRLARAGLLGVIPYMVLNVSYYFYLYSASKMATSLADKWAVWCISAGLLGWSIAMMTVAPLSQIQPLLYVMIALAGSSRYIFCGSPEAQDEEAARPGPAPHFGALPRGAR